MLISTVLSVFLNEYLKVSPIRSKERRVGKECSELCAGENENKKDQIDMWSH